VEARDFDLQEVQKSRVQQKLVKDEYDKVYAEGKEWQDKLNIKEAENAEISK
jgi:hypothetical protein